jgi:glycosyltransferase involved in cell wall biosynthesis
VTLSVVLPVLDDQAFLQDCLDSLRRQSLPVDEIIVVDRGSTDASREIVDRQGNPVRSLALPDATVAAAVAAGMAEASGETVVSAVARARYHHTAIEQCLQGAAALQAVGTTSFGRAVAAVSGAADGEWLECLTGGKPTATGAGTCGWWYTPDTSVAWARRCFERGAGPGPAALVAASVFLAANGRPRRRATLPALHAVFLAVAALRAGADHGVAPHRAFLAAELAAWCGGAGWWAGRVHRLGGNGGDSS